MKKVLTLLICLALLLNTAACSFGSGRDGRDHNPKEVRHTPSPEESAEEEGQLFLPEKPAVEAPTQEECSEYGEESAALPAAGNTRSVQHRTAGGGRVAAMNGYSYLVEQNDFYYFTAPAHNRDYSSGDLCRISVDGGDGTVILYSCAPGEFSGLVELQVVGDWIYLLFHPRIDSSRKNSAGMTLKRMNPGGTELETLRSDIVSKSFNTVIIRDGYLYCTVYSQTQISASHYQDTCHLIRMDLNTRETTTLFTQEDSDDLRICAYHEDAAVLQGEESMLLLDLNSETVSPAPEGIASFSRGTDSAVSWMPGTDGSFWLYACGSGDLYRFLPETGYEKELYMNLSVTERQNEGPSTSSVCEFVFLDLDHFITNCAGNIREGKKLWFIEYGTRRLIVDDYGGNLSYPGDGYLYYSYRRDGKNESAGDRLCSILLDGTGWESLDW